MMNIRQCLHKMDNYSYATSNQQTTQGLFDDFFDVFIFRNPDNRLDAARPQKFFYCAGIFAFSWLRETLPFLRAAHTNRAGRIAPSRLPPLWGYAKNAA
jgi:hypothetical protein